MMKPRAKKRFGQHFLHAEGIVNRIVHSANLREGDKILEIGPGLGALTKHLYKPCYRLQVVEYDKDMVAFLQERWPDLSLYQGDATQVNWPGLLDGSGWKCVSNLPYNVGTKIVTDLLVQAPLFSSLIVMLQLEVAKRMIAKVGDRNRGSLSTFIEIFSEAKILFRVPKGAFHPPPKVESAVIELVLRQDPLVPIVKKSKLEQFLKVLYSRPRKTIRNCLKTAYSSQESDFLLAFAQVDGGRRPATLHIEEIHQMLKGLDDI